MFLFNYTTLQLDHSLHFINNTTLIDKLEKRLLNHLVILMTMIP